MKNQMLAPTYPTPYYAVIFSSVLNATTDGYAEMDEEMGKLAREQQGFLGVEWARNNLGITVSYWSSLEAIKSWKNNSRHLLAQKQGRDAWYTHYRVRICKVERDYEF